jgi:hypothetical protein
MATKTQIIEPLDGSPKVTQWYGQGEDNYKPNRGHSGIDYSCIVGTPVRAVADGDVAFVGVDPQGYGNYIRLWHPQLRVFTLMGHLSEVKKKKGDAVSQGDIIALTGNTGNSTGPHLHYEIRRADKAGNYQEVPGMTNGAIDPLSFLAGLFRGGTVSDEPTRYEATPDFLRALAFILRPDIEGGWSDHPQDPGGATMKGVTLATYTRWCAEQGKPVPTKDDLKAISDDAAQQIYIGYYWLPSSCDKMEWPMQLAMFDASVNCGVGQAATFMALSRGDFIEYMGQRVAWYTTLSNWDIFGKGWTRRCAEVLKAATG